MGDLGIVVRTVVSLAAVLGLLMWLSHRIRNGKGGGKNPLAALMPKKLGRISELLPARPAATPRVKAEKITVVARSGLGGKAQLVVAEFGGIRYVLGVTEQGISVVDTQEAVVEEEAPARAETSTGEFGALTAITDASAAGNDEDSLQNAA